MSILLMAGGNNTRWKQEYPKEMAIVQGQPLIERTVDMLDYPTVITHKPEIMDALKGKSFIINQPTRWLCDAILQAKDYWGEENTVLLGDVIYTPQTLSELISPQPDGFYGNDTEIFGVHWNGDSIEEALLIAAAYAHQKISCRFRGKLWTVHRAYEGQPCFRHYIGNSFVKVNDSTTDIDTMGEYLRLKATGVA